MGFFVPEADPGLRGVTGRAPDVPQPLAPGAVTEAAFRQDNVVVSLFRSIRDSGAYAPDPNHNPIDVIRNTPFEQQYLDQFVGSQSEAETRAIMARIEAEERDQRLLEGAGWGGIVAQLAAGTLDPTLALPAGQIARAGRGGYSLLRSAGSVGAAAGAQATVQESVLQATQETRALSSSALSVASATLLGGLLGGGAARLLNGAERKAMTDALDVMRSQMDAHAGDPAAAPMPAAAGAAATDTRAMEIAPTGIGIEKLGTDPMSRTLNSASIEARRAVGDLAETPVLLKQNLEGQPTTLNGPPVNRLAISALNQTLIQTGDELNRLFGQMRGDSGRFLRARAWFDEKFGEGGMSMERFKEEVADALMANDQHAIPEVAEAARFIRANVFEKWGTRAEQAIPEFKMKEFDDQTSYFPHIFDKTQIRNRRPEFTNIVVSHLRADQDTKRGIQERLGRLNDELSFNQREAKKLEEKIAALSEDAEVVEARREEATRINKFAFERATALREGEFENVGGIREDRPGKNLQKAQGGAVFETKVRARGNVLSEQLSAKLHQIETLEAQLAKRLADHDSVRARIEADIGQWHGQSSAEAKSAIKAREKYRADREARAVEKGEPAPAGRLASADDAIDRAVRTILQSDRDLDIEALRGKANEIVNHIVGSPDGRLPYDMASGGARPGWLPSSSEPPRGALARRDFAIPTKAIREFIERDVEHVVQVHMRTVAPDVLIAERFGDTRMTDVLRKIEDEYAAKIDAAPPGKAAEKLGKERERIMGDVAAIRDRIRGVYGADIRAAMPNLARAADAAKNFNYITSMGSATITSLADMAGVVFRNGLGTAFREAWAPYFSQMTALGEGASREQTRQLRAMGIVVETDLALRVHELNDITATHKPQSRLERTLQYGADKFGLLNMLAPWTDRMKAFAGGVAMAEILRAARAASEGTATARQTRLLGESNISPAMADRIWKAFSAPGAGEVVDRVHLPNVERWTDAQAREAFEAAVARESDIAVVTPGQEKPRWLSNPVVGILGQFKSFAASSTQRILIANLQRRDAEVLQGLLLSIGLGMLSYKLNSVTGGQKTSDRPQDWFREGISRSGIMGWLEEGNALASKASGGTLDIYRVLGSDKPLTRFASRGAMDQLLGPTAGKVENLLKATSAAGRMDWRESDTKALRRVIPMQNLFYLRRLLDQAEAGFNGAFGIEMKVKP